MGRTDTKLNVKDILERMIEAAGAKNIAQLAGKMGLTPQALNQAKYRESIALPLLTLCVEQTGTSLDYLVYGVGNKIEATKSDDRYVEIKTISSTEDPGVIMFDKSWLETQLKGRKIDILRQIMIADTIYIIDTTDKVVTEGLYVFGFDDNPAKIRQCKRQLDDSIRVSNEEKTMTQAQLEGIGIIGRVVWKGESLLEDVFAQYYA